MVVIDPHPALAASNGGVTFHAKGGPYGRTNGAKRVMAVDVTGLAPATLVVPASCTASTATEPLLEKLELSGQTDLLELVIVDRGTSARQRGRWRPGSAWRCAGSAEEPDAPADRAPVARGGRARPAGSVATVGQVARGHGPSATGWLQAACLRGVLAAC